jgi:hypothetical protein
MPLKVPLLKQVKSRQTIYTKRRVRRSTNILHDEPRPMKEEAEEREQER